MEEMIIITPDMEIMRGKTTRRELCNTHYIVFLLNGIYYISGDQHEYRMKNGNVVVYPEYTFELARSLDELYTISVSTIESYAYNAYMTGAH